MKKLAIMILGLAALLGAQDYSGVWNGKGGFESAQYGSVPQTATMTLVQAGSSISGTLKIGNGAVVKITGSVSGTTITFSVNGGSGTLTQNGSQLQGRLTSSRGDILDIVFTQN